VRKPALSAYPQLVQVLTDAVLASVLDAPATPFVLFGHSLGSLLAFGVARELRQRQVLQPCCLLCASASAPQRPTAAWPGPPPQEWSITELAAYLRAVGGTPETVLDNATFLQRLLPRMQVDLAVRASFTYSPSEPPLAYPLAVFGGLQDASTATADLAAWGEQTSAHFSMHCFAGGHLFLHEQATRQGFLKALAFEAMWWEEGV
jgi:medium-chain acyl-[acyl-carrier-protein] hydrolase